MSRNSNIDFEKAAESTIFCSRIVADGKPQLHFRINYLALINLHTDVEATVKQIKAIVSSEERNILERDTLILLQARNWRFHLVACGVMLAGVSTDDLINQLWKVLHEGSWIAPQLAATAYLLDTQFPKLAMEAISQGDFDRQSIVALTELLQQDPNLKFTEEQKARINFTNAKDSADSGRIAVSWAEKVRFLFTAT